MVVPLQLEELQRSVDAGKEYIVKGPQVKVIFYIQNAIRLHEVENINVHISDPIPNINPATLNL